jgi:glycosyltransferase involved in cell wall biosynthesis
MKLAFLTGITRKLNSETILNEPLGGTHSAMINLAGELVKLGHEVTIFCNCPGHEGTYNGIEYLLTGKIIRFSKEKEIDVFICVASESTLKVNIRAKKTVLWLHNDYSPYWNHELSDIAARLSYYMAVKADKVVTVSKWQTRIVREIFKIPENHIEIKSNGLNVELFKNRVEKDNKRLIYTSAPDRGLDLLLEIFPAIRQAVPETELHIYSSFSTWGKAGYEYQEIEQEVFETADQEGVFLHKPLPVHLLADELLKSSLWTYPNHQAPGTYFFAETFCISALEAQAASLPVIASKRGALPEIVLDGSTGILIEADPYSEEFKEDFAAAVINLLTDEELRQLYSDQAKKWAANFSWPELARHWQDFLNNLLNEQEPTKLKEAPLKPLFPEPQVSIIIPTFNRARNLAHVLNGLTRQDYKLFEVIIADDGSTDNTKEVVDSFRDRLNIRYAWCGKNKGFRAARTRNTGLRKARGEIIVFLDSDIVVPPAFLTEHRKAHESYDKLLVNSYVYRMKTYSENDLGLPPAEYIPKHLDNLAPDIKAKYNVFERGGPIEEGYYLDSNCLSVKASHIRSEGFDPDFTGWGFEDVELGYRFTQKFFKFLFIKENCTAYHIYHEPAPEKEADGQKNWEKITKKYRLKSWYVPLPSLKAGGLVKLNGVDLEQANLLTDLAEAEFEIKVGDRFNAYIPCFTIDVSDGEIKF